MTTHLAPSSEGGIALGQPFDQDLSRQLLAAADQRPVEPVWRDALREHVPLRRVDGVLLMQQVVR